MTETSVKEILEASIIVEDKYGIKSKIENIDTVAMAIGSRSVNQLAQLLEGKADKIITIGDAVKVRKAMEAVEEGFLSGLKL